MLYSQTNHYRTEINLNGLWECAFDFEDRAGIEKWSENVPESARPVAVPGSWNDQFEEYDICYHLGATWYYKRFGVPRDFLSKPLFLRVGAATYRGWVYLNGQLIAESKDGFLPVVCPLSQYLKAEYNLLAIKVSCELSNDTCPVAPQSITKVNFKKNISQKPRKSKI